MAAGMGMPKVWGHHARGIQRRGKERAHGRRSQVGEGRKK